MKRLARHYPLPSLMPLTAMHANRLNVSSHFQPTEQARFFPSDAALASWMALADQRQAHIVYETPPGLLKLNVVG